MSFLEYLKAILLICLKKIPKIMYIIIIIKINCVLISFVFLMMKLLEIESSYLRIKNCVHFRHFNDYIYQQTRQKMPTMLWEFYICTQVSYVNKLEMNNLLY